MNKKKKNSFPITKIRNGNGHTTIVHRNKKFISGMHNCTDKLDNLDEMYVPRNTVLWKILKEIGMPDHPTCLLRNLYAGQKATVRTGHGTTDWFQIGKRVCQAVYCHPAYVTYMQSTS